MKLPVSAYTMDCDSIFQQVIQQVSRMALEPNTAILLTLNMSSPMAKPNMSPSQCLNMSSTKQSRPSPFSIQLTLELSSASKPQTSKGFVLPRVIQPKIIESSNCPHLSRCTLRQPLPPPLPSVNYRVNHTSMYQVRY